MAGSEQLSVITFFGSTNDERLPEYYIVCVGEYTLLKSCIVTRCAVEMVLTKHVLCNSVDRKLETHFICLIFIVYLFLCYRLHQFSIQF